MSRTLSTASHQGTNEIKVKTSKDSRTDDLRSPPKIASPSAYIKNSEKSPRQPPSGANYAWISLKNPNEKPTSTRPGSEKDVVSPEPKAANKKEKEPKKASSNSNSRKPSLTISVSSRPGSNQPRPHKGKSPSSATENQAANNKLKKQEDVKTPLMTEASEKMTPSGNLKLTLENINSKTGSLSHRVTLNSPAGNSNKVGGLSPVQNKGKPTTTSEANVRVKQGADNAKGQLNTLLISATKQSNCQKDPKVSKVSSKDFNSTTGTPRQGYDQSCEAEGEYLSMKKYKELLGMLQERDREIKRLAQDKNQLQSTLSSMGDELKTLRQVNILFKERGKSGVDFQDGLSKLYLQLEESSHQQTIGLNLTQSMQKSVDNSINRDFRPSNTPNGFIGAYHDGLKGLSDRTGKSWLTSLEGKVLTKEKRPNNITNNSSDNLQIGGRSSLTTSPNEESIRQRYDTLGEDADYVKEVGMESEKPQKKKKQSGKGAASGHGSPRKPGKGAFKKKKREATSVDQGTSLIKIIADHKESEQSIVKKKRPEFKSMEHFVFGPSDDSNNVDIGEALSELKNRVERLLRNKNALNVTKTQLLYQNLHERLQKAL